MPNNDQMNQYNTEKISCSVLFEKMQPLDVLISCQFVKHRATIELCQICFVSPNVSFSACANKSYVTRVHVEAPCALIAAGFGVMPSPGPSGTSAYPLLINGFAIPSTTLSYHESDASSM